MSDRELEGMSAAFATALRNLQRDLDITESRQRWPGATRLATDDAGGSVAVDASTGGGSPPTTIPDPVFPSGYTEFCSLELDPGRWVLEGGAVVTTDGTYRILTAMIVVDGDTDNPLSWVQEAGSSADTGSPTFVDPVNPIATVLLEASATVSLQIGVFSHIYLFPTGDTAASCSAASCYLMAEPV